MSLNKFTEFTDFKPWMNIRANTLAVGNGAGRINTQAYAPSFTATTGTVNGSSAFYYTCDHTSLRIKGYAVYVTSSTSHNSFQVEFKLPTELVSRFGTGAVTIVTGYVGEVGGNTDTNNGLIVDSRLNATNDGVLCDVYWNKGAVTTSFPTRIYVDCCLFKQG